MDSMEHLRQSVSLLLIIISIAVAIPTPEEERINVLTDDAALATREMSSNMYSEWSRATKDARRALLTGSLEEMYNVKKVVTRQSIVLRNLLVSVKTQLTEKCDSSPRVLAAIDIVDEQMRDIENNRAGLIGQADRNLDTVKAIVTAEAEAFKIISWDSVNKTLLSLLRELKCAGKKD